MPLCEGCGKQIYGPRKLCDDCKHNLELERQAKLMGGREKLSDEEKRKMLEERKKDKKFWWG